MGYDLYVEKPKGDEVTQLRLLVTNGTPLPDYLSLIHGQFDKKTQQLTRRGDFNQYIGRQLRLLQSLGLNPPSLPNMAALPPGSWFLQFTFTLARPWISKDDDSFYVTESVNPVRKDKVFKVPTMSAASWKGLLRWTTMHTRLAQPVIASEAKQSTETVPPVARETPMLAVIASEAKQSPEETFAQERLVQTLLFGDEKGEEPGQTKDFAAYLDDLGGEAARRFYMQKLRKHFRLDEKAEMPHHSGRLMFYPTFFNLIDVEVINPHSRKTRAGTHPIYLECVPIGAQGTFSLLYVPFDLIGKEESDIRQQALANLELIAEGLSAMFLTYGFSAKRTSGYGVAEDRIVEGEIRTKAGSHDLKGKKLSELAQEVKDVSFD